MIVNITEKLFSSRAGGLSPASLQAIRRLGGPTGFGCYIRQQPTAWQPEARGETEHSLQRAPASELRDAQRTTPIQDAFPGPSSVSGPLWLGAALSVFCWAGFTLAVPRALSKWMESSRRAARSYSYFGSLVLWQPGV